MTIESHVIPVSSGLFEHRERIGPAVWEFLWCIDAIQGEEVDDAGERWGLVFDGLPVKHEQIALDIQSSARTVKRNMAILKQEGYISATRVSRGEVIKVRKNKKSAEPCGAKIGTSHERDGPEMAHQSDSDRPEMAHHTADLDECGAKNGTSLPYDRPNLAHHEERKDLKDINSLKDFNNAVAVDDEGNPFKKLMDEFCILHGKLDVQVKNTDVTLMSSFLRQGIPVSFIVQVMHQIHHERTSRGATISSFAYYKNVIIDAWAAQKAITDGVPIPEGVPLSPVALGKEPAVTGMPIVGTVQGTPNPKRDISPKNQRALAKIEEEMRRERERSAEAIFPD